MRGVWERGDRLELFYLMSDMWNGVRSRRRYRSW